jgi:hypothetical protein
MERATSKKSSPSLYLDQLAPLLQDHAKPEPLLLQTLTSKPFSTFLLEVKSTTLMVDHQDQLDLHIHKHITFNSSQDQLVILLDAKPVLLLMQTSIPLTFSTYLLEVSSTTLMEDLQAQLDHLSLKLSTFFWSKCLSQLVTLLDVKKVLLLMQTSIPLTYTIFQLEVS